MEQDLSWERALSIATEVAQTIRKGIHKLSRTAVKDLPLLAHLPLFLLDSKAKKNEMLDEDISTVEPKVYDIFIFGSTAVAGKKFVGDVDLIIIDSGFFSNFLGKRGVEYKIDRKEGNLLREFLVDWCNFPESQCLKPEIMKFVDLIFLPCRFFKDLQWRRVFSSQQRDPNFLFFLVL